MQAVQPPAHVYYVCNDPSRTVHSLSRRPRPPPSHEGLICGRGSSPKGRSLPCRAVVLRKHGQTRSSRPLRLSHGSASLGPRSNYRSRSERRDAKKTLLGTSGRSQRYETPIFPSQRKGEPRACGDAARAPSCETWTRVATYMPPCDALKASFARFICAGGKC